MAETIATLSVDITANTQAFDKGLGHVQSTLTTSVSQFSGIGSQIGTGIMQGIGISMGLGIAEVSRQIAGLGVDMIASAATFDNSMRNVNSILQLTNEELGMVSDQVLSLGANSVAGPQAVASAFYEIVSGVADTSTHMDILTQSIRTAEAGQADLIGTTNALVSIMNAYRFSADKAANVSDILTATVAKGVGSMDAFGAAFGQISGLGSTLNVSLEELGAELAYITTRGFSASEAAMQLSSAMTAFINPSDKMKKALRDMGYESGSALIKAEGLAGAMQILNDAFGGNVDQISELLGRKEALQAFLATTGDGFTDFFGEFESGIEGATDAARNMQLESTAQQWELFKSKIEAVGIALGEKFLPLANQALDVLMGFTELGSTLLGIDLGFDVSGDPPDLEAEAERIIGPVPPPIDVTVPTMLTYTIAPGDTLWDIARAHGVSVADLYNANPGLIDQKFIYANDTLQIPVNTELQHDVTTNVTSMERLNAALYETADATKSIDPTTIDKVNAALSDLVGMNVDVRTVADAFEDIADSAPPDIKLFVDQLGRVKDLMGEINLRGFAETGDVSFLMPDSIEEGWADFTANLPELIDTMGAKIAVEFLDLAIAGVDAANQVIEAWNKADITGLGTIETIDTTQLEAEKQAIIDEKLSGEKTMAVRVELTNPEEVDDMLAAFNGEPVTMTIQADGLTAIAENVSALEEITGEPLTITVGEDSYTSVTEFNAALMAGTYDSVTEPLPVTISQSSFIQTNQLGMDMDWATRNRMPVVTIDSNLPGFAYDLNNTVRDRVMTVILRLQEAVGGIDVPGFAAGGDVAGGNMILVGEKGPELFVPPSNGQIIPNHDLSAMTHSSFGGGGGVNINGGTYIFQGVQDVAAFYTQMREHAEGLSDPGFVMGGRT